MNFEEYITQLDIFGRAKLAKWLIMTNLHRKHPNLWAKHGKPKRMRKAR